MSLLQCVVSYADHITPVGGVDSCSGESATPRNTRREHGSRRLNVIMAVCQNSLILHPGGKEKPRCKPRKTIIHRGEIQTGFHRHAGPNPPARCFSETSKRKNIRLCWCATGSASACPNCRQARESGWNNRPTDTFFTGGASRKRNTACKLRYST